MVWDSDRQRVVLFGGVSSWKVPFSDTWDWDGTVWTLRRPLVAPSARMGAAIAYDEVRHRVVLFGGLDLSLTTLPDGGTDLRRTVDSDTWEFDGSSWTERTPPTSPPAALGVMAFDSATGKIVLLAGSPSQHWEWDGVTWALRAPATTVPGAMGLAFDSARSRLVAFTIGGTWEWDGSDWLERMPVHAPSSRTGVLAFDSVRNRVVLFGGSTSNLALLDETWTWDGTDWTQEAPADSPAPRSHSAGAFDRTRGRMVLFGGTIEEPFFAIGDTWEWDGSSWLQRRAPPIALAGGLAFDEVAGRMISFGGSNDSVPSVFPPTPRCTNETRAWDGVSWRVLQTASSPSPRCALSMSYDRQRHRLVLFGGVGQSGTPLADTWEWDGTHWFERTPSSSPAPRGWGAMAWDEVRQRTVLVGGRAAQTSTTGFSDVWEWDGTTWSQVGSLPMAQPGASLIWDAARQRMLLAGGGIWERNGTTWTPMSAPPGTPVHDDQPLAYDPIRETPVLGRSTANGHRPET